MSDDDYPNAYSEDWLVWVHQINGIMPKIGQSPISNSIAQGLQIDLLGNGEDKFDAAKNLIMNGLRAAQRVFGEAVPASDRTVTLGHNSPEQMQALEKIDALIEAVKQANDLPGTPEEKGAARRGVVRRPQAIGSHESPCCRGAGNITAGASLDP